MNEDAKAAADALWNSLKQEVDTLSVKITALYEAAGSPRHCRHINELWHPENAAVGLGFVPPEAIERLEALIAKAGFRLHKSNGPLGKAVYFSLLNGTELTIERLKQLGEAVEKETLVIEPPKPKPAQEADAIAEEQLARVEGLTVAHGDKLRSRPPEVSGIVDAFNAATGSMTPSQVIKYLKDAITYFDNIPDISRKELLRTIAMMEDAEKL